MNTVRSDEKLEEVARRLATARRVTVVTGAGVSAASGVPTFRGAGGLWRNRQAQQLATPEAFAQDPLLVWEWYAWRRQVIGGCTPNAAHHVDRDMERAARVHTGHAERRRPARTRRH